MVRPAVGAFVLPRSRTNLELLPATYQSSDIAQELVPLLLAAWRALYMDYMKQSSHCAEMCVTAAEQWLGKGMPEESQPQPANREC